MKLSTDWFDGWALLFAVLLLAFPSMALGGERMINLAPPESGAVFFAEPTSADNGRLAYINDGYDSSYWYAGDLQPRSDILVMFRAPSMVHSVRFLSWATGRHAPSDYQVFAINSSAGKSQLMADVKGDTTRGPDWVDIKTDQPIMADQILLRIADVQEHEHGALIYEMQVLGTPVDGSDDSAKLDPNKIYLLVDSGKTLSSQSAEDITMAISAGLPGKKPDIVSKRLAGAGLVRQAIDLSQWEGKTISLTFEASGKSEATGVWLDPRLVKGSETLADLVDYWSANHEGFIDGSATVGANGARAIACSLEKGGSSLTMTIPISATLIRKKEEASRKLGFAKYGASEERLQSRGGVGSEIDLTGKWQMAGRDADSAVPMGSGKPRKLPAMKGWQWHNVTVPGSVRSGLLEAGVIEDPYWSDNAGKSIWTEKMDWWFRKTTTIPRKWAGGRISLGFDGVDYYASVWVNGKFLGDHEGLYGGPVYDVTPLVTFGKPNAIVVQIHPGGTDEPGKVFKGFIFMKWHYQTDISPRGIWRGVRLVATGPVRLENPFVKTLALNDKEASLEITADIYNPGDAMQALISGTIAGINSGGKEQRFSLSVKLSREKQTFSHRVNVANPSVWWPKGMGAPNLYRLILRASVQGRMADAVSASFGIRKIEFDKNPGLDSDINSRFMCKVNGKLISMRGAGGFGAHDQIYRYHARKDAWFIKVAQDLNYNFIRVHGSGIIASDEFYDLCDRMGMMVWQEFMVSNVSISGEHPDVWRAQTIQSILRLRNHPSLIRWCGGNEFNPDSTNDDNRMIVDMFEESVAKYDGTRIFTRASQYVNEPHYNDESGAYGGLKPAACTEYSGVYAGNIIGERSLRKFLPDDDVKRWPPVTKEKLDQFLPQDVLARLDNSRRGAFVFHTALTGRCEGWGWPGDLTVLFPQWVFFGNPRTMDEAFQISQVCGGYTTGYTMETFRSRWPHPSLYASWDYAPIWPMSIIWGPVDYYGVVQPSAYYYKRAQEPLHVLMQYESKEQAKAPVVQLNTFAKIYAPGDQFKGRVYVASDIDHPVGRHMAEVQVFDSKLDMIHSAEMPMEGIKSGPASLLLGVFTWDVPSSMPNQVALVCVSLRDDSGALVSRSVYPIWISSEISKLVSDVPTRRDHGPWLTDLKAAVTRLKITSVSQSVTFSGKDYLLSGAQHTGSVVLEIANKGAKPAFHTGVEITNADCRYVFSDNYFMLMPGETKRVTVEIDRSIKPFYDYVKPQRIQPVGDHLQFTVRAWNAPEKTTEVKVTD